LPVPRVPINTTYFIDEFPCGLPPGYWTLFLKPLRLGQQEKSSAIPGISRDDVYGVEIPLPPLNEQRRIVAKLEKLLDKVDSCQKRLAKIPILLKRFRQAVLAAACSGELTADWREKSQSCSESEDLDLPGGWTWQTVHNLVGPNGLFDGPFGSNLKTADYTGHGVRVIRLENIAHLKFLNEKKAFISEQKYQDLRKHTVRDGDIIFSSFIEEEIRVCVLPPLPTQAIAKADCFCLRPNRDSVDIRYLTLQLASPATYNRLLEKVHGATRPRINTTQLRDLIVPVCPPNEQHEIVRRVDELFALTDQVEARFAKAKQYVDNLKQSILAKAFRGELVPQGPNDEPAVVLVERIHETRGFKPLNRYKIGQVHGER
jgi:type I restriction enzyme, S subunit